MQSQESRNNSASVRRALEILEFLAAHADTRGRTLAEVAKGTKINKSTVLRLMVPLREAGLVDQDDESERYRLGPKSLYWAQAYLSSLNLPAIAAPVLHQLMETTRETVHLVVYDHGEVVYIDKVESPNTIRMFSRVGLRNPAYCTAVGKAMLAYLPEAAFNEVVGRGMPRRTDRTITTPEALRQELEAVRHRGYAIDDIENESEVRCVGAPIFDYAGTAVAAVSVSGPASRITLERAHEMGRIVKGAAEQISERLGFRRNRLAPTL